MDLILRLGTALLILVISNIILGSLNAWFAKQFNKVKFWQGIVKGFVVTLIAIAVYMAGYLVPEFKIDAFGPEPVNLTTAMLYVVTAGFLWYAKEVLTKLSSIISGKKRIEELTTHRTEEP
jgi:uncharacterized membrane protein YagU involved in acid resistance